MPDTYRLLPRRPGSRFFRDLDGHLAVAKDHESTEVFVLDWTDELGSDTIASVEVDAFGVTSTDTNTTTQTTHSVEGSNGIITVKVTTAAGEVLVQRLRFISPNAGITSDYGRWLA